MFANRRFDFQPCSPIRAAGLAALRVLPFAGVSRVPGPAGLGLLPFPDFTVDGLQPVFRQVHEPSVGVGGGVHASTVDADRPAGRLMFDGRWGVVEHDGAVRPIHLDGRVFAYRLADACLWGSVR